MKNTSVISCLAAEDSELSDTEAACKRSKNSMARQTMQRRSRPRRPVAKEALKRVVKKRFTGHSDMPH